MLYMKVYSFPLSYPIVPCPIVSYHTPPSGCKLLSGATHATLHLRCNPYNNLYLLYCSKRRDRALNRAAEAAGGGRSAVVHLSLGKDPYVRGCHKLLASDRLEDAELLSLVTSQTATVARGDDLRQRKLSDLGTRTLSCVGELHAELQLPELNLLSAS